MLDLVGKVIEYTGPAWSPTLAIHVELKRVKLEIVDYNSDNYGTGYIACEEGADEEDELKWYGLDADIGFDVIFIDDVTLPYVGGLDSAFRMNQEDAAEWLDALLEKVLADRAH